MPIPAARAAGTLLRPGYASVDGPRGCRSPSGARWALAAGVAALLAGCARPDAPVAYAVPADAAARIRLVCPPNTFIGTMTADCPRPLPPAGRLQ